MNKTSKQQLFSTEKIYQSFVKPILSSDQGVDAEQLTQLSLNGLQKISLYRNWPGIAWGLKQIERELQVRDPRLEQNLFGCNFLNPIGLAAGFDKNGVAAAIWDSFGFGFSELGTVTWHAQEGNPKPRLFRLAIEQAALNRMGFNNKGADEMRVTLQKQKLAKPGERSIAIGLNLGKSKITSIDKASDDYESSLQLLAPLCDYAVINVSSPNTAGLRDLQSSNQLRRIISKLKQVKECPPLLVKIAPDLSNPALHQIAELACEEKLAGLIAVNTSIDRFGMGDRILPQTGLSLDKEAGGLSGRPLRKRALEVIRLLRQSTNSELPLIGVGGIDSPESAWERLAEGSSLIQIYTGWIFQGPVLVPQILNGILTQLDRHGFTNISEVIGTQAPWLNT